jgi:protein associated with RNAse G/E
MLGEIGEKVDKLTKIVDKHEYQINNQTINKADEITKIVLNQVRQNLPNFTTNSDVY